MKKSSIAQSLHHLRIAKEYLQDFQRQYPGSKGAAITKNYESKINWIYTDLITIPSFPADVVSQIKKEWNSDVLAIPEIHEKISLLCPEAREVIEQLLDNLLAGETIQIEKI